jgi:hypothetical protein
MVLFIVYDRERAELALGRTLVEPGDEVDVLGLDVRGRGIYQTHGCRPHEMREIAVGVYAHHDFSSAARAWVATRATVRKQQILVWECMCDATRAVRRLVELETLDAVENVVDDVLLEPVTGTDLGKGRAQCTWSCEAPKLS